MNPNFRMALAEEYRRMTASLEYEEHRSRIIPVGAEWYALREETCLPGYDGELA